MKTKIQNSQKNLHLTSGPCMQGNCNFVHDILLRAKLFIRKHKPTNAFTLNMIDNVIYSKLLLQTDSNSNTLQLSNSKASIIPSKQDVKNLSRSKFMCHHFPNL